MQVWVVRSLCDRQEEIQALISRCEAQQLPCNAAPLACQHFKYYSIRRRPGKLAFRILSFICGGGLDLRRTPLPRLEKREEELFRTGPLSVLTTSVKSNSQVSGAQLTSSWQFGCSQGSSFACSRGLVLVYVSEEKACFFVEPVRT